jgi:hypothetical protein
MSLNEFLRWDASWAMARFDVARVGGVVMLRYL